MESRGGGVPRPCRAKTRGTSEMISILWSGGWDSMFRLLELSQIEGLSICPIYIRDHGRPGMAHELAAMRSILPQVRGIARASVLDVDLYDRDAICRDFPNEGISAAYERLAEEFGLGYQYELFALLCEGLGIRAECAVEDSPRSKAKRAIDAQCLLVPCESPCRRGRFRVVSKGASSDAATVLGRLDFGMLDVSKVEAKRMAQESGWMSVMRRTWFCHAPVNGKPCGTCNPCKDAMAEGMRWRMPLSSRLRYHAWHLRSATARLWWPRSG